MSTSGRYPATDPSRQLEADRMCIAYHCWDATIEPATYQGLPFEMSMEAHQATMVANGSAEAVYDARQHNHQPVVCSQDVPTGPTPGLKLVDAVITAAKGVGRTSRDWLSHFNQSYKNNGV